MATESGYSNQKKYGDAQYKTIQGVGSSKLGVNTAQMYLYDITPAALPIVGADLDPDDNKKIVVEITGHGAKKGDVLRIMSPAALAGWEYDIIEVIDADFLVVFDTASETPGDDIPQAADDIKICRWVTAKADSEGALTTSSGPVQYVRNGATQTVVQDTVTPANNRPLPAGIYIVKDGEIHPVTKDTGTPANTLGIPVEIVAASGTPINITAGDIQVQLTDLGVNFDAVRIGDGSGVYIKVESDGSINVVGIDDVIAAVESIDAKTPALVGGKVPVDTGLVQALTDTQLRATPVPVSGTVTVDTSLLATSAKQDAQAVLVGPVNETAPASDTANSGLNGRLQRIAQRITSLIALFPLSLGQKTMANSFAVTLASDQSAIPVTSTTTPSSIAGTVTSAQIAVGTGAVRATVSGAAPSASRKKLMVKPSAANTGKIYIGASGVTTANGLEIIGPDRLEFEFDSGDYYVISDTAAQVVEILEKV